MKKLLFAPLVFLLFVELGYCQSVDMASLREKVRHNKNYIVYTNTIDETVKASLNKEFSLNEVSAKVDKSKVGKLQTLQEFKDFYRTAGVKGGDRLAALQYKISYSLKALIRDIPELKKIPKAQFNELLKPPRRVVKTR